MKKALIISGLLFGLFLGSANSVFASSDYEKVSIIVEIGTLSNNERYTEALALCNSALKDYPNEPELYYWRATIKSSLGNNAEALNDYNKVIMLEPKDSDAYVMRGSCKSDLGDMDGAIEDYNKAIELNSKNSSAYSMRACTRLKLGDLTGASEDLETANKLVENSEKNIKK